jgi:hypothetical protein
MTVSYEFRKIWRKKVWPNLRCYPSTERNLALPEYTFSQLPQSMHNWNKPFNKLAANKKERICFVYGASRYSMCGSVDHVDTSMTKLTSNGTNSTSPTYF